MPATGGGRRLSGVPEDAHLPAATPTDAAMPDSLGGLRFANVWNRPAAPAVRNSTPDSRGAAMRGVAAGAFGVGRPPA